MENNEKNTHLFLALVSSLVSQAWIQLGKVKNPMTDKIERNLDAASMTIDMLAMVKDKTSNNTTDDEKNLLDRSLSELRMNFIAERDKKKEEIDEKPKKTTKKEPKKDVKKKKTSSPKKSK